MKQLLRVSTGKYTVLYVQGAVRAREGYDIRKTIMGCRWTAENFFGTVTTLYEAFEHGRQQPKAGCANPGEKDCLGTRAMKEEGGAGEFVFQSYDQVAEDRDQLGSGMLHLDLTTTSVDGGGHQLVGILSSNRYEWVLTEHACYAYKLIPVSLFTSMSPDVVALIFQQTRLKTVFCSATETELLVRTKQEKRERTNCFTHIVQFEEFSDETKAKAEGAGLTLLTLKSVKEQGRENLKVHRETVPNDLAAIMYTSGTTGDPKGVMLSHKNIIAASSSAMSAELNLSVNTVHLSHLPLAHSFERLVSNTVITCGGKIGFFQGNVNEIVEDLQALRPTLFASAPRFLNWIYDKLTSDVGKFSRVRDWLFETGLKNKRYYLKQNLLTHKVWDTLVFNKLKTEAGMSRCTLIVSGMAPIAPHVVEFLCCVMGIPVIEGYGQTECSAVACLGLLREQATIGHVGAPFPCNFIRLKDVPHIDCLHANDQNGQDAESSRQCVRHCGRGEICVKGANVFQGYYGDEMKTKEVLDENGWLHTGDIGDWDQFGNLMVFDRIENIVRLCQGVCVAPQKIEAVYMLSHYVAQVFVYGDSFRSQLVGIVIPDPERMRSTEAGKQLTNRKISDLCDDKNFRNTILADMQRFATECKLQPFETVGDIHLEPEMWVPGDLLTPSFMLKRAEARRVYHNEIDQLYTKLENTPRER
eukprot:gb/GECG01013687.1/.p1 GENE.gb/GECG01013687.1/~~gb/GECG01013687.1/.p1  ORF type:complete len:697 (+),score=66.00 gb/GECG01013687.1/:1-2091(+)